MPDLVYSMYMLLVVRALPSNLITFENVKCSRCATNRCQKRSVFANKKMIAKNIEMTSYVKRRAYERGGDSE